MPEEIKVVVKQESQGNAIEATQAKIKELYQLAATYESKGIPEAASSVRAEAKTLERDLARSAKERLRDEKAITHERASQVAIEKARASRVARVTNAVANFAEGQLAGVGGFTGITSALGSAGGTVATTAALAAAIATATFASEAERGHLFRMGDLSDKADREAQERKLKRLAGFEGTSSSNRAEARDLREEAGRRESAKEGLFEAAKPRWWHPQEFGLWANNLFGANMMATQGEDAIKRNAAAQQTALRGAKEAEEQARKKFAETGGREIEIQERMARGDMQGVRAIEDKLTRQREYNRLKEMDATDEEAGRGADAKVSNIQRERAAKFGRLVTARDGMADVARLATLAAEQRAGVGSGGTEKLRADMNRNHREAADAAFRVKFSRPSLL